MKSPDGHSTVVNISGSGGGGGGGGGSSRSRTGGVSAASKMVGGSGGSISKSRGGGGGGGGGGGSRKTATDVMAQKLYDAVYNATDANNRWIADIFMTLPTPNELPEYYQIVTEPIDMDDVKAKIDKHKYTDIDDCMADFDLMFANAHEFNEAGSEIYEDATTLRMVVHEAYDELDDMPLSSRSGGGGGGGGGAKSIAKSSTSKASRSNGGGGSRVGGAVSVGSTRFTSTPAVTDLLDYSAFDEGGRQLQKATRGLSERELFQLCQATFEAIKKIKGAGQTKPMSSNFLKIPSRASKYFVRYLRIQPLNPISPERTTRNGVC